MASDLAIIHALQCSLNPDATCLGDACPYFPGKKDCTTAATEDAIYRLRTLVKGERRYKKGFDAAEKGV